MRNYQYTPQEEAEMDAFGNEWKKHNRGIKGPSAWREFKQKHPWAKRITADALRQKYTRLKRDQYWRAYAVTHAKCPRGHAVCYASEKYEQGNISNITNSINDYVSRSTATIPEGSAIPSSKPASSTVTITSGPAAVTPSSSLPISSYQVISCPSSSPVVTASPIKSPAPDIVNGDIPVELPKATPVKTTSATTTSTTGPQKSDEQMLNDIIAQIMGGNGKPSSTDPAMDAFMKTILGECGISKPANDQSKGNELANPVGKLDTKSSLECVLQIANGQQVPVIINGRIVTKPSKEAGSNTSSVPVPQLLQHVKDLGLSIVDETIKQFDNSGAGQKISPQAYQELMKKLKASLDEEIEKLIKKMLENSK